jgi:hypothetical protein
VVAPPRLQVRTRGTPAAPCGAPRTPAALALRLFERQAASTCTYCHDPLSVARHACGCGAAYHRDCWTELGRCATLGCLGRPDHDDRRRAGLCPGCGVSVARTLPWERLACKGCGARYHLGCRMQRARCATTGCRSGDRDRWGAPPPAPPEPLLSVDLSLRVVLALLTGAGPSTLLLSWTSDAVASLALGLALAAASLALTSRVRVAPAPTA